MYYFIINKYDSVVKNPQHVSLLAWLSLKPIIERSSKICSTML